MPTVLLFAAGPRHLATPVRLERTAPTSGDENAPSPWIGRGGFRARGRTPDLSVHTLNCGLQECRRLAIDSLGNRRIMVDREQRPV